MPDAQGFRRKFGVLGPSTNTIVQPDFDDMRPYGVTNHYSRIFTPNANAISNETFRAGAETIGRMQAGIRRSLEHARAHPADSAAFVARHAQELAPDVVAAHIET
ncbi:MAG: hypothetical protein ACK4ST_12665, partial [Elioraea tepidiphila]